MLLDYNIMSYFRYNFTHLKKRKKKKKRLRISILNVVGNSRNFQKILT